MNFYILIANWKSGLTVALISIPLSISLAVASGVGPVMGIITAIWAGLIGALFGGSNYNIIGPTGALSGMIAAYALSYGPAQVPCLAIMVGIFIVIAYAVHIERYLIFIPSSVIHGFTLGVACIIAMSQLNGIVGLSSLPKHGTFIANVLESLGRIQHGSLISVVIFLLFFISLFVVRALVPSLPSPIIVSPFGIMLGYAMSKGYVSFSLETLSSKFGMMELSLAQLPVLSFHKVMIIPALVIAFIAVIETMLSAKIADTMTKTKHHARQEVLGLGIANIICGLVGGMPATAALARTALNVKTGATSYYSAILNSIFTAMGAFLFLSYFSYMPMAVIAAILIYVACTMIEHEHFERLWRHDKPNFVIAMLVAGMTVYEDPIIGILSGTAAALLLLVNKLSESYYEIAVHEQKNEQEDRISAHRKNVLIYTFKGKLVYLNNQAHIVRFQTEFKQYVAIILLLDEVYFTDIDGVDALEDIIEIIQQRGQQVGVVRPHIHLRNMLHSSKKFQELEKQGLVFDTVSAALHRL